MIRNLLAAPSGLLGSRLSRLGAALTTSRPNTTFLSADKAIEEEQLPYYDADRFHPVHPGDVLHKRYQMISKLGAGSYCTVWLARDIESRFWHSSPYVTVKVGMAFSKEIETNPIQHEVDISRRIRQHASDPYHEFVRPSLDHFEIPREDGDVHHCLVHQPMRESIWTFQSRFEGGKLPIGHLKPVLTIFLKGLDFLHSKCNVVHGDIKRDNMMMSFENPLVLENYVKDQPNNPMDRKVVGDRTTYLSHDDFGIPGSGEVVLKIVDFDRAQFCDWEGPKRHPMQPSAYRAPEVLMGMPWSHSVDIWNLGVCIWNMLEREDLFLNMRNVPARPHSKDHVAQMIGLLGHPPKEFLDGERKWRDVHLYPPIYDQDDNHCFTPCELFGGPFFDDQGRFLYNELIPKDRTLADTVQSLKGDEKTLFLDFVGGMLRWVPEHRKTAKELLEHPWLAL